jgi:hypothetical protein
MLGRIFPKEIDNTFRGHRLGLWLFVPLVLMKLAMGVSMVLNPRFIAVAADGIPLDRYDAGGADAVVSIFALLGLLHLLLSALNIAALIRYRAMIPLMYLVMLTEYFCRRGLLTVNPIVRSETGSAELGEVSIGVIVNMVLLAIMLAGFVLSVVGGAPKTRA